MDAGSLFASRIFYPSVETMTRVDETDGRPRLAPSNPTTETIGGEDRLLMPGLADGHMHIDKTLLGLPWGPIMPAPKGR